MNLLTMFKNWLARLTRKIIPIVIPTVEVPHPDIRSDASSGHNCRLCHKYNAMGKRSFWIADNYALRWMEPEDVLAATLDMQKKSHSSYTAICEACVPKITIERPDAPAALPPAKQEVREVLHAVIRREGFSGGARRLPAPTAPERDDDNMPAVRSGGDDKHDERRLTGSSSLASFAGSNKVRITADRMISVEEARAWENDCQSCAM